MSESGTVQQVRDRVLQMTREIEELAHSDVPPRTFFRQFLQLLVTSMGARAGVVWMRDGGNQLSLITDVNLAETGFHENPQANRINQKILTDVMATGEACAYGPDDRKKVLLPTEHLIVVAALQQAKECVGVVEVFQRPDAPPGARPGYLQFVEQMCGYASRYLERRKAEPAAPADEFWGRFEEVSLQLQQSLRTSEVAATAANDGRLLLECDRLSVVVRRGKKTIVEAVSSQDMVNHRANLIQAMNKLAASVMDTGEAFTFSGKADSLPPQIEEPLAAYIQESETRMVMIVPLFESEDLRDSEDKDAKRQGTKKRRRTIGCLVAEQFTDSQPNPALAKSATLLADHAGAALFNAQRHERIFLLSLWQTLGRCREWFVGRKLAKTLAIAGTIVIVSLALVVIPWEYRVEGNGRLMPVVQRQVFAPLDGEVVEVSVSGGEQVAAGQKLLQLHSDQLSVELVTARNDLNEKLQLVLSLQTQIDEAGSRGDRNEELRLSGRLEETRIEIEGLRETVSLLEERHAQLTVVAPIEGVVASFQIEQLLQNRPVRRGEVLLEVMDETSSWRLELEVEEHRVGHILQAQQELGTESLPVEFILATKTEETFTGELDRLATRAATSSEHGSVIEVFVSTDADSLPDRRIGAEVSAKIGCGNRALGYVLFGDVIEFVRKHLWL